MRLFRLESEIENDAVDFANDALGVEQCKLAPRGSRHWPDRIFFIEGGKPLLIEFKRRGQAPRKGQSAKIRKLRRLGYHVEVCNNVEDAKRIITQAVEAARVPKASHEMATRTRKRRVVS